MLGFGKVAWSIQSSTLRQSLWATVLLLTGVLIAFPTSFVFRYEPLQSISVFGGDFTLFVILYYLWLGAVMLTLAGFDDSRDVPRGVLLSIIFVAVNVEFWTLRTNLPVPKSDGADNLPYIAAIQGKGNLFGFDDPSFSYFAVWPIIQLMTVTISSFLGVSIVNSMELVIILDNVLTMIFLFLTSYGFLHRVRLACLTTFLFSLFSVYNQASAFTPSLTAIVYLVVLLWLISKLLLKNTSLSKFAPIIIVVEIALAFANFITMSLLTSILVAVVLLRRGGGALRILAIAIVSVIVPFLSNTTQTGIIFTIATTFQRVNLLLSQQSFFQSKVGGSLPFWVSADTLFWQVFLFSPALVLLVLLAVRRRLGREMKIMGIYVVGFIPFGIAMLLGSIPAVILTFLPIFTSIIILLWVRSDSQTRIGLLSVLLGLMIILALPTFIAYNRNQPKYKYYLSDSSGYQFSGQYLPHSAKLLIVMPPFNTLDYISSNTVVKFDYTSIFQASQVWIAWDSSLGEFATSSGNGAILIFSERSVVPWASLLNINVHDPHWSTIRDQLNAYSEIYDNGNMQVFT
jgi:hypothetical protein